VCAMRRPAAVAVFLLLACAALGADLLTKRQVFGTMLNDPALLSGLPAPVGLDNDVQAARAQLNHFRRQALPGVRFTLSTNPGAVFGFKMPRWLMAAATVATVAAVLYFFAVSQAEAWLMHTALALVLGGALGNLYDRLFSVVALPGYEPIRYQVRDFIDCSELYYKWVFNVADAWLVIGAGLLAAHWLAMAIRQQRQAVVTGGPGG